MTDTGWVDRLRSGFRRTSDRFGDNLTGLWGKAALDEASLDELEEGLIASDLGPSTAAKIRERLAGERFERGVTEAEVRQVIAQELEAILAPVAKPLDIHAFPRPQVILVVGVNGSGKTTTIAKLAHLFMEQDYSVLLAAGDTFRAAAIEQLRIWGDRAGVPVIAGAEGSDSSAIVFDGVKKATAEGIDVLIVDTAGRLQNKKHLMDELAKIRKVLGRLNPAAPHDVVLVLDATTGQNGLAQIDVFKEVAGVTGLVMTKLDGTARGGVMVAAADKYGLPIHAIGVGEGMNDFRPFDAAEVASAIAGVRGGEA
jgi:fused signal recognition particle receptor